MHRANPTPALSGFQLIYLIPDIWILTFHVFIQIKLFNLGDLDIKQKAEIDDGREWAY